MNLKLSGSSDGEDILNPYHLRREMLSLRETLLSHSTRLSMNMFGRTPVLHYHLKSFRISNTFRDLRNLSIPLRLLRKNRMWK